jgi:hypothetical protein
MAKKIKFPRGPFFDPDIENPEKLDREEIDTQHLLPVKGNTPFGRYDNDPKFRRDAKKFTMWAAKRLGYPEVSIEVSEHDFYSALEESIDEFSRIVGNQNIEDNLEAILGSDADRDLTGRWVSSTGVGQNIQLSQDYGSPLAAGAGGNVDFQKGFIELEDGRQIYDKTEIKTSTQVAKDEYEFVPVDEEIIVHRVFHEDIPSSVYGYYGAGYSGLAGLSGGGAGSLLGGGATLGAGRQYTLYPLYDAAVSIQDLNLHEDIFESDYSFEIIGDKIKVFPTPGEEFGLFGLDDYRRRLWVEFVYADEALGVEVLGDSTARASVDESIDNIISDYSDAPYDFIPYRFINAPGKRWIFKYAYEVVKHKLGTVRSKFSDVPSPQDPFQLDGQDLKQDASDGMQTLVDNLKEQLDKLSKEERLRRKAENAENLNKVLSKIPTLIYRDN